jgi:hypothetical protein
MFLVFDSVIKFSGMPIVSQSMTELGYPVETALGIGLVAALLWAGLFLREQRCPVSAPSNRRNPWMVIRGC